MSTLETRQRTETRSRRQLPPRLPYSISTGPQSPASDSHLLLFPSLSDLEQDGFSKNPFFHGIVAEVPEAQRTKDGERKQTQT